MNANTSSDHVIRPNEAELHAKCKIIVVDDDECILGLLKLHLLNAGYDVRTAEDAVIGGRMALRDLPDLMIVDVDMPYMDGYEFVAALKADENTRDIPIVFLTSRTDGMDQAKRLGAAAYLTKPIVVDRLLEVVDLFGRAR
jgi:two-component system alkaline phosphatase synthesis response regulator PhoP